MRTGLHLSLRLVGDITGYCENYYGNSVPGATFLSLTEITITDKYKRTVFANFYKIVFHSKILAKCPTENKFRNRILKTRTCPTEELEMEV